MGIHVHYISRVRRCIFCQLPIILFNQFRGSLPRLDGRIVLFRDAGRFLRVSPESRKPTRGKDLQHVPDH